MKSLLILVFTFLTYTSVFLVGPEIEKCYLSFDKAANLTMVPPERFPVENDHTRMLATGSGDVELTIVDGYRILYNNQHNVTFVNLKVELSKPGSYNADQHHLIDNLRYLNANSANMESKQLLQLDFNAYKIYGLSRSRLESGSTLGIFVMFPGNDTVVYFYFNNLKPGYRNFETIEDYKKQRDGFMKEYTLYLNSCLKK